MPAGTSLEETNRVLNHIEKFLRETPEVESYSRRTGARLALAIAEPNTGDFLIKLKRTRERCARRGHHRNCGPRSAKPSLRSTWNSRTSWRI